ncbi:MAG: Nif3-like dinuclear metal center hexameric protein [Bacteroidetes bacterium]|nr:Nif3-like dinuclear metal center hexameric protein [Bacteroidota bacterium]
MSKRKNIEIAEIINYLESVVPLSFQEDYDNCGLLTGDPEWQFRKALLCLDVTSEVISEAIFKKCNLIISHHPPIFHGLKKLTVNQPETEAIVGALKNDVALYAIHTNLDNTFHGLNAHILSKLGISEYIVLSPKNGMMVKLATFCPVAYADKVRDALFKAGAGYIGNYDCCSFSAPGNGSFRASEKANPFVGEKNKLHLEKEVRIEVVFPKYLERKIIMYLRTAHPYEEVAYDLYPLNNISYSYGSGLIGLLPKPLEENYFLEFLKSTLNLQVIRHSAKRSKEITRVGICTGSGSFLIPEAIKSFADVFLTADLKYHDFFTVKNKLLLADIGHYESETCVKEWLHAVLVEKFPNFAFLISEVNTNPVYYL